MTYTFGAVEFVLFMLIFAIFVTFLVTAFSYFLQKFLQTQWFFPNKIRLNPRQPNQAQSKLEFIQQLKSVFASVFVGYGAVVYLIVFNQSKLYINPLDYSIWWLVFTVPVMIILSDLYLYCIHRTLHLPLFYRSIHLIHHRSVRVNIFSSYSLDIVEAVAYTLFLAIFIYLFPTNIINFILFMALTVIYNYYIHSGWEILPTQKWFTKVLNTATLHHLHHIKHDYNFALYTSIWDRLFGTGERQACSKIDLSLD